MTELDDRESIAKEIPEITSEEDKPFPAGARANSSAESGADNPSKSVRSKAIDKNLNEADDLNKEITRFRYQTGRRVLYIAMAAMGVSVVLDIVSARFLGVQSDLVTSAFEAFKLITMTVLGYIFGSNSSNSK